MNQMITYPLNNIDYTAEDAELYFSTRQSGVYDGNDFETVASGIDNDVTVNAGIAWIQNSKFSGKVVALKEPKVLTLDLPNSVYDRIDAIVIQFDANANATDIVVKKGIASSAPVAPTVVQTESLYELHIYHVLRKAGSTVISAEDLVDQRRNRDYCGIMIDPISSVDNTLSKNGYAADAKATGDGIIEAKTAAEKAQSTADGKVSKTGDTMTGNYEIDGYLSTSKYRAPNIEDGADISEIYSSWLYGASYRQSSDITVTNAPDGYSTGKSVFYSRFPLFILANVHNVGLYYMGTANGFSKWERISGRAMIESVWKNASPASEFAAQTVSLDLSDANMVIIIHRASTTSTVYQVTLARVAFTTQLNNFFNNSTTTDNLEICTRNAVVTATGVQFRDAYRKWFLTNSEAGTLNNKRVIPYQIYAIKGVL